MKLLFLIAVLIAVEPCFAAERLLTAIAVVESGSDDAAVGRHGERGRFQITRAVWRQYSREPFALAHSHGSARVVALAHVRWIQNVLGTDDVWLTAAAWNAGVSAVLRGKIPASSRDYADRVLAVTQKGE